MKSIYEKYVQHGGKPCFKSQNFIEYNAILDEIYSIASSDMNIRDMKLYERLVSLITMLMSDGFNHDGNELSESSARDIMPVKRYIDEHYSEKITLDFLSEIFYINKYYLTRLFKKQLGCTIVSYLLQVRITHAKQMLKFTDMSMEYISEECGFSDTNYFSRAFKKVEGVSPMQFRKMW
jgi:YesN/AraC family two-component response regulator